jgi:hypothetical protein
MIAGVRVEPLIQRTRCQAQSLASRRQFLPLRNPTPRSTDILRVFRFPGRFRFEGRFVGLQPPFSAAPVEAARDRSSWASAHCSQASRYCSTCFRNLCPCSICCRASSACSGLRYREWVLPAIGRVKLGDPLGRGSLLCRISWCARRPTPGASVLVETKLRPAHVWTKAVGMNLHGSFLRYYMQ